MTQDLEEMEESCICTCGEGFDLSDGNPCHHCRVVFCSDCAYHEYDLGWICRNCKRDIIGVIAE